MTNWYGRPYIGRSGGTDGCLDLEDGALLKDGDFAIVVTSQGAYVYQLDEDSGLAESDPTVIAPDTNAGSKRWILKDAYNSVLYSHAHTGGNGAQIAYGNLSETPFTTGYVDLGDSSVQKTQADVTCDDSWKTGASRLDFSATLPAGTKAAVIDLAVSDDQVSNYFQLRLAGQSRVLAAIGTNVANVSIYNGPILIACDSDRKFEYRGKYAFTSLSIIVQGYFI